MPSQSFPQVEAFLQSNQQQALDELIEFLKIPSVSADSQFKPQMQQCAQFVQNSLTEAGMQATIHPTEGHPIVTGERIVDESRPTVLIYGHYDVQPPDPLDLWTTPAFEPTVRDGKLFARGATDDKGQLFTHIKSVEAWTKTVGDLPVNVRFVIEGEEEVGSNNLDLFLEANKESWNCDVAVVSDTSMYSADLPAITYGLRGILACEVTLHGPNRDLHSGVFGGSVLNPVTELARMVASLHNAKGEVQIPGFYNQVIDLTPEERAQFAALPFDQSAYLSDLGLDAPMGEQGFSTLERRWARPTCELNGLYGGYTGEGPKTIVPSKATAKITCRLVPDQDAEALTKSLEQFLTAQLPPGGRLEFTSYHGCPAHVFDYQSNHFQAASKAIENAFGTAPVYIREGGSIPVVASFREILGLDTLLLGWGLNSDNLHSPDEHFSLDNFHRGTLASAHLWNELGS